MRLVLWAAALMVLTDTAYAQCPDIDDTASQPLQAVSGQPQQCTVRMSHGWPVPDPACTPGAINPSITVDVLTDPGFRTRCIRQHATTEEEKATTYDAYGIDHPANNHGASQTCELDHLVPLEIGGADTLDNIWPQCGPDGVSLSERFFKQKDGVENYLAMMVKSGQMDQGEAQRGIATDWTQYLNAARAACPGGRILQSARHHLAYSRLVIHNEKVFFGHNGFPKVKRSVSQGRLPPNVQSQRDAQGDATCVSSSYGFARGRYSRGGLNQTLPQRPLLLRN